MSRSQLTLETVATYPLPGTAVPGSLTFSPNGRLIAYLFSAEGTLTRQLYALDLATTVSRQLVHLPTQDHSDESVPLAEALRRERLRQRETGITQYAWSRRGSLLIPLNGNLYIQESPDAPLRLLLAGNGAPLLEARFSPDGQHVAYVQDAELFVIPATGGQPRQLTSGARGTGRTHGLAEYVAQEEMGRHQGYWWSPDSQQIAFTQVDETHIPAFRIMHLGKDVVGEAAQEDHHYPFAGQANARVKLGIVSVNGGEPVWMDLGANEDVYLARVNWLPNGRLTAQIQNREQSRLDLVVFDPQTGATTPLLTETSTVWINLHDLFWPLRDGRFIWGSERSGFQHLYLYEGNGELIRPLTGGDWLVEQIAAVDEANKLVYFMGTRHSALERHLYVVSLNGSEPRQLTEAAGLHEVVIDVANGRFLDTHHNRHSPPTITLRALEDGRLLTTLYDTPDPRLAQLDLPTPELVTLPSRDGVLLHGAIYHPPHSFGAGPHPTIVFVYGGPTVQRVQESWLLTVDLRAQYLAARGFLVFKLDNRGSARRGLQFESAIHHNLGDVEVQDQVDGVRWLINQGFTDPARVGIYGWSYGGYMAAICLARAADTFHVAVAGAPVTHWDGYDTHYTERYMGLPQSNPQGYHVSSVMHHAARIRGKLLLVHGLIDENVHFRHTARLINTLNRARIPYDLLIFPDERHMPRRLRDRIYLEERVCGYFEAHL